MRLHLTSVCLAAGAVIAIAVGQASAVLGQPPAAPEDVRLFESLLSGHQGMPYEQLQAQLPARSYLTELSFDPTAAKYFNIVSSKLELTDAELAIFRRQGFVCVDHDQRYSFPSMYYTIYVRDLPILVTADSVLHALHRSYEDVLTDIETYYLMPTIDRILADCHSHLALISEDTPLAAVSDVYRDVDLYLTVARSLLASTGNDLGGQANQPSAPPANVVRSQFGQEDQVREILSLIDSLTRQYPADSSPTEIYGGRRYVDYSQFRPRGHYAEKGVLVAYFRCLMWLGRADCGFHLTSPAAAAGVLVDVDRELRDAVLLTRLLTGTNGIEALKKMGAIVDLMVGSSDDLTPMGLADLLAKSNLTSLCELATPQEVAALRDAIVVQRKSIPRIRSQVIMSDPHDKTSAAAPHVLQMFGQRFTMDSFILSQVVYDSILSDGQKVRRMMPSGLDVMAALGNDTAVSLLADELTRFHYSGNVWAAREYVDAHPPTYWQASLPHIWLQCIRTLDDDLTNEPHAPEVMRTRSWQIKQLQAQLASWSELRHDTLLYGKQAYAGGPGCEYPTGYVEPYPELYAGLASFADEAVRLLRTVEFPPVPQRPGYGSPPSRATIVTFFQRSAEVYHRLGTLARKELAAEPFTAEEQDWLKRAIDRFVISGPPSYNGWYCDLFYRQGFDLEKWCPTVADVFTDPESATVLQAGVGDPCFCVAAIDSGPDRCVFVGPAYSYYEFTRSSSQRMTDPEWRTTIGSDSMPPRPFWVKEIQGPTKERAPDNRTQGFWKYWR